MPGYGYRRGYTHSRNGGGGTPVLHANFSADNLTPTTADAVAFTSHSTLATTYHYEKNDGSGWVDFDGTPTIANPSETFAAGTWSVRLTVGDGMTTNVKTKTNYIVCSAVPSTGVLSDTGGCVAANAIGVSI